MVAHLNFNARKDSRTNSGFPGSILWICPTDKVIALTIEWVDQDGSLLPAGLYRTPGKGGSDEQQALNLPTLPSGAKSADRREEHLTGSEQLAGVEPPRQKSLAGEPAPAVDPISAAVANT